jgi:hypothetical protein
VFFVADIEADEYPGDDGVRATAIASSDPAFGSFVGVAWDDSHWDYGFFSPSRLSWYDDGDREFEC